MLSFSYFPYERGDGELGRTNQEERDCMVTGDSVDGKKKKQERRSGRPFVRIGPWPSMWNRTMGKFCRFMENEKKTVLGYRTLAIWILEAQWSG
ncbi:uncharacterized protein HKW66_Vig0216070 [Vigna angularis]|uniref:Uncharacterized protein n=1 Tax=Phaseolus angularis TaxID=3914 RepID=A0A8T0JHJ0_PHAAN|nr:uncharacterized protein HKW66_Vig0216070 [Vigna angularis]